MSWTTQETKTLGGSTVLRQIGDQVTDIGHRVVVDAVPGDPFPLGQVARSGDFRAVQPEFNLQEDFLPTLFEASTADAGGSFPAGPVTITVDASAGQPNCSLAVVTGDGDVHSWAFGNNAGAGGDDDYIDDGGGPDGPTFATRIETRIDAVAIAGLDVERASNVLTITHASGVVAFSTHDNVVVS